MLRRFDFIRAIARLGQAQFHVGLSAAQPDVTHQNFVQHHALFRPGDFDRVRTARRRRLKLGLPTAIESGALKRLMGRYATREDEIDRMLRAYLLVDLHTVTRRAIRASVEHYSLKALEPFYGFARKTPLEDARTALRQG